MRRIGYWVTSSLVLVVVLLSSERINAQPGTDRFVPFNEFAARTASEIFSSKERKVANAAAFEEMRHHILKTFLACTLLVLALCLFSFHDISRTSEQPMRTPAAVGDSNSK